MSGESTAGRRPRVSDEEILDVLRNAETPVSTTAMIAEELPIGRRGLLNRLTALDDSGQVESMDVGSHAKVWWLRADAEASDPEVLKSFGKYEGTDIAANVAAVAERFDDDVRARRDDLSRQ